jgi:hypothetical protein
VNLKIEGDKVTFGIVTRILGASDLVIIYLDTLILSRKILVEEIDPRFRGQTTVENKEDEITLKMVCISDGNFRTFFPIDTEFAGSELVLPNGRTIPHSPCRDTEMQTWLKDNSAKCDGTVKEWKVAFAEPSGDSSNPLNIILGLIIPVLEYRRSNPESQVSVLLNVFPNRYVHYLDVLSGVTFIDASACECYKGITIKKDTSEDIATFRGMFDERQTEDLVGFLADDFNVTDEQLEITAALCPTCKPCVINRQMSVNRVIREIQRLKGLVCPSLAWLGHAAALGRNSFVVLQSELLDVWVGPFLSAFELKLKHLEVNDGRFVVRD